MFLIKGGGGGGGGGGGLPLLHTVPSTWHQRPVSLRLMTSQFKDIVTHTQKVKTVKCILCGVWVQNFVWNFKGVFWNFTQKFEPIHCKICILRCATHGPVHLAPKAGGGLPLLHTVPSTWHQRPVSLRLMTSQFKDIVTHTQKVKTVKCILCGVWVQNFVWNFKGVFWNFTQKFEPIHCKICILRCVKNGDLWYLRVMTS